MERKRIVEAVAGVFELPAESFSSTLKVTVTGAEQVEIENH